MSNLADTVEGSEAKCGRFSNIALTSDSGILQKNSTLRNWFLKPTADQKGGCSDRVESSIKDVYSSDKSSQKTFEERKLGRRVRSFFKQTNSNKDGSMSEDEDDASFWRKASNICTKRENSHNTGDIQKGSFTKKIRNSIFKGPNDGKEYSNEKSLLLPVEFSSDDENESRFTDANSHVVQSKSPEKISSKYQRSTKSANNKGLKMEYEKSFEEYSDENEDEFSPATPPENVLEGPYKFVFQTPNTFTSQPNITEENDFHNGGRYVIDYLSKKLATMNIEIDFASGRKPGVSSEEELYQSSENIIESIANEISKYKMCTQEKQDELEKLKLENLKISKLKHENLEQKQEINLLKTKLESINKKKNDLTIEMKKLKNKSANNKTREYASMDENENEDITKSNTGLGILELNVNETSKKSQQSAFKPSKYLPRETRNNETRLKHLEKKIFGLERSLEKKKKQIRTNSLRIDLNRYTIDRFLTLLKSLNEVLQFHNVYGNNLKENEDNIIKIDTYCSALNIKTCFEDSSLRLQENSFKRQLGPLFANFNFSLVDQLTMNFRFYERSANFQKETIGGLRMMLEDKDNYIKTLMQHLKKKEGTKLIKDRKNDDPTLKS
ncbi:Ysw1p [Saccharomyces paradoxus]|uniref:Ysw1p n=1 Tax=Saccharomyces paradoxus TaxID=27291 RepID=A0A8B8ULR6_SACPA|nr:Ysw1 [Saccharomyces paradoxus]QHS71708.1 Ysw1 [Saccharomyces paradoxus]